MNNFLNNFLNKTFLNILPFFCLFSCTLIGLPYAHANEKVSPQLAWKNQSYNELTFTEKEQQWLNKNIPIRYVYDPDWAPFERTNDVGQHAGIIADILNLLKHKSRINLIAIKSKTWAEAVKQAESRHADMYSGVGITDERKQYMDFSDKHIFSTSYVFVSRQDEDYLGGFEDLQNKKIALVDGYTIHGLIKVKQPNLPLVLLDGTQQGFDKLITKEIDIFLVNTVTAKNFTQKEKYKTLKLAYKTDYKLNLNIAIRNDWPDEVLSIINKSIAAIDEKEFSDIYDKWTENIITTKTDYSLLYKVAFSLILLILIFIFWNRRLNSLINAKTLAIEAQKNKSEKLLSVFDSNVIASKTDKNGVITYVSVAFCEISGYAAEELIGKTHSMVRHPDMPKALFADLWKTITANKVWSGEIKNRKKNGDYYWVTAVITPETDNNGNIVTYSAIRHDITDKKAFESLSDNLEKEILEKTKDLKVSDERSRLLLTSVGEGVFGVGSDGLVNFINPAALEMLQYDEKEILGHSIHALIHHSRADGSDYPVEECPMYHAFNQGKVSKIDDEVLWRKDGSCFPIEYKAGPVFRDNQVSGSVVTFSDITERQNAHNLLLEQQQKIKEIHRHTSDSIEYAALIQSALIPDNKVFKKYFKDFFAIWHPKDVVGGDIYLVEELSEHEVVVMVIDCTGHGVPGAFVTMLVKAVERQITANFHKDESVSPARILSIFNRSLKHLLKQESIDSISNAGFDGGVVYYNKKEQIIKFSGAETPLFYSENDEIKTIKGSRHSVGYKKSDPNYQFKEHEIKCKAGMNFYLTTDGYLDQNGGDKAFPFGKKRFIQLLDESKNETFADQQELYLYKLQDYQQDQERNDDVTFIGFSIDEVFMTEKPVAKEILNYHGVITQNFISACMDNIEYEVSDMKMMGNLSTVVIELCQNMMNYSKNKEADCRKIVPLAFIELVRDSDENYQISSKNILSIDDKNIIEPKLLEIQSLDKAAIRKKYRELRKSGKEKHDKGAGIGLYEIAKIVTKIDYSFNKINDDKYEYLLELSVQSK